MQRPASLGDLTSCGRKARRWLLDRIDRMSSRTLTASRAQLLRDDPVILMSPHDGCDLLVPTVAGRPFTTCMIACGGMR